MKIIIDTPVSNPLYTTTVPLQTSTESQAFFDAVPTSFSAMSEAEKLIFNGFIKNLVNEGLYNKLDEMYLYLPILVESERLTNVLNPSETLALPSGYVTFDANGANAIKGWGSGKTILKGNKTVISYNTTNVAPTRNNVSIGGGSSSAWLGRGIGTSASGYLYNSTHRATFTTRTNAIGTLLAVNDNANEIMFAKDNTGSDVINVNVGGDLSDDLILFGAVEGSTTSTPENAIGLHAWGSTALTEAEADKVIELIDGFINTLMV